MEDATTALRALAGEFAQLDPQCAVIPAAVPTAVAAVAERAEQARVGAAPHGDASDTSTGRCGAAPTVAEHGITRHRVRQLGAALLTLTLEPADAQALAKLLTRPGGVPRQTSPAEPGWGEGPARTVAAALAEALTSHGTGAYARIFDSSHVSAGLPPLTVRSVITALATSATPPLRG